MQVESEEHESGHVVLVMQKGYTMKDRTLRAAMVSTAK
jgi:molecular chaperone GrpE